MRERVTSSEVDIEVEAGQSTVRRAERQVRVVRLSELETPDMKDPAAIPPLQVFYGQGISVEVSRRRQGLPFMHRNMDADELIICVSGWAKWETETGNFEVRAGDAILIPRGIAHRPAEVSDDYLAVELKVSSTKLMPRTS